MPALSAGWMSDHLSDASRERNGPAFESLTMAAALAHRVAGKWVGIVVLSNTFRHPAVLAKAATVLDNVTRGRFILGLGAGWHEGEHDAFGIPLPPLPERFDRYESALRVLTALFSDEARTPPGVSARRSLLPAPQRHQRAGPDPPRRPPDLAGRVRSDAGSRSPHATRRAGRCPAIDRETSTTSQPSGTRSGERWRRRAGTPMRSRSRPSFRAESTAGVPSRGARHLARVRPRRRQPRDPRRARRVRARWADSGRQRGRRTIGRVS